MENKNGQGVFYGVIGVATLVVAIIGATFAYFSASVNTGGDGANAIQGQSLGGTEGGVLGLTIEKITWSDAAASSNDLVPTDITSSAAQTAITAKCEATSGISGDTAKYTGCHLYRIVAEAGSNISSATLSLSTFTVTGANVPGDWNHALYSTTDGKTATSYTLGSNIAGATSTGTISAAETVETTALTANTPKVYYMVVWLADDDEQQNAGDSNDATGSYAGTFSLEAAGGSTVKATFTS